MELRKIIQFFFTLTFLHFVNASSETTSSQEEDQTTHAKNHNFSHHTSDEDSKFDPKTDKKLIRNLQRLPTDKLKSILNLINKDEDEQDEEDSNNQEMFKLKPENGERLHDQGSGSSQNERKLSFHKSSHQGSIDVQNNNKQSKPDSQMSKEQTTERTGINEADKTRKKNLDGPLRDILIHAFEGGNEDGSNEMLNHLENDDIRTESKDENLIRLGHVRSSNDVTDKDDNHEDVFADTDEMPQIPPGLNINNETTSNRINLMRIHTSTHNEERNNEAAPHTDTETVDKPDDVTTFVNPITLKPITQRNNHYPHYRRVFQERLPTKIIEEINSAMVKNVQESGDKTPSIQDGSQHSEIKKHESMNNENKNMPSQNYNELDASKRGRPKFAFSYDPESPIGPEMWKVLHTDWTCQGRKQSPINIRTDLVVNSTVCRNIVIHVEPEGRPISGILRNNGHAPTLSLTNSVKVRLIGGTLPNDYFLKQLHFHFGCENSRGSEHQIDGQKYPLELHLVFWDKNTFDTFALAAKSDRGIAVVAVLFQQSIIPPEEEKKTPLVQLLQVLRKIPNEGDMVQITELFNFRLEKLIPLLMNTQEAGRFFTYEGSLSTPGCYESVTWIVFDSHPVVTDDQLKMLRKLKSTKVNAEQTMCDNFRPIQKSYGRRIYSNII